MKPKHVLTEVGKNIVVIAFGGLYFLTVFYMVGLVVRHEPPQMWEHILGRRPVSSGLWLLFPALDFLVYIIPALVVAGLTSVFRPRRWLIYSLLLVGPIGIFNAVMYWIHVVPNSGIGVFDGPLWRTNVFILVSILYYGLPPLLLWLFYKISRIRSRKLQLRVKPGTA